MSYNEVGVSPLLESGLGTVASLVSARTGFGRMKWAAPSAARAAAPTAPTAIKARRFIYVARGVISEEGIELESDLRMSIAAPLSQVVAIGLTPPVSGYKAFVADGGEKETNPSNGPS